MKYIKCNHCPKIRSSEVLLIINFTRKISPMVYKYMQRYYKL